MVDWDLMDLLHEKGWIVHGDPALIDLAVWSSLLMTTVAEISGAVRRLPKRELAKFRKWFAEFDAAA